MYPETPQVEFYQEAKCPYCRSIYVYVIIPLSRKGLFNYERINVDIGGTKPHDRWKSICQRIGGPVTPLVRVEKLEWNDDYIFFLSNRVNLDEEVDRMYRNLRVLTEKGEERFKEVVKHDLVQA